MAIIQFFLEEVPRRLKNRRKLKEIVTILFKKEGRQVDSLNYIFCNDQVLLNINRQYLNHDFYTDVISFCLSGNKEPIIGEVYVSVDRVKENSRIFKTTFQEELARVILHGALHLCGYKDKSAVQRKLMKEKENFYLDLYEKRCST